MINQCSSDCRPVQENMPIFNPTRLRCQCVDRWSVWPSGPRRLGAPRYQSGPVPAVAQDSPRGTQRSLIRTTLLELHPSRRLLDWGAVPGGPPAPARGPPRKCIAHFFYLLVNYMPPVAAQHGLFPAALSPPCPPPVPPPFSPGLFFLWLGAARAPRPGAREQPGLLRGPRPPW